ncbi:hypothetical protein PoB_000991500 [Plakobranchus ocellatus]|uniref:Uncharacterized protein n=1 Tax=Plakobranchus ocellatus TaxID=259542 RepID=A0AAV3YLN9_9GAST|nr:hypothetical protein PoB_000991500 [Plakobranchus ocellatus]
MIESNRFRRPQQGDSKLSDPPSSHGAGSGARTRDRRVTADLRADSLSIVTLTTNDTPMQWKNTSSWYVRKKEDV